MAYVYRDGQRLTPWMKYCVDRFSAAMQAKFGEVIYVSSGIRTYEEQRDIFLRRYVTAGNVRGRRVYDTRVWNGVRYYRIDPAGTVAVPRTSNHEIQGTRGAVDLRDSGRDRGITTHGTARANWARANAHLYGLRPEGYNFAEPWHFSIDNIYNTPPAQPAGDGGTEANKPAITEDTEMLTIIWNGKHIFTIGQEYVKHETNLEQARTMGWLFNRSDRMAKDSLFVGVDDKGLNALQKSLALPWYAIDAALRGVAFNLEGTRGDGSGESGRVWSRSLEINAKLDGIKLDTANLAKSIEDLKKSAA